MNFDSVYKNTMETMANDAAIMLAVIEKMHEDKKDTYPRAAVISNYLMHIYMAIQIEIMRPPEHRVGKVCLTGCPLDPDDDEAAHNAVPVLRALSAANLLHNAFTSTLQKGSAVDAADYFDQLAEQANAFLGTLGSQLGKVHDQVVKRVTDAILKQHTPKGKGH